MGEGSQGGAGRPLTRTPPHAPSLPESVPTGRSPFLLSSGPCAAAFPFSCSLQSREDCGVCLCLQQQERVLSSPSRDPGAAPPGGSALKRRSGFQTKLPLMTRNCTGHASVSLHQTCCCHVEVRLLRRGAQACVQTAVPMGSLLRAQWRSRAKDC